MQKQPEICAIVAVGPDNVIGRDGIMPWHSPTDFYHFRKMTVPYPCVFGRKTFENLPKRPLPNRLNLVCSSHYKNEYIDGVFYAKSFEHAISECVNAQRVFICGGAGVYRYALERDLIDVMYLTIIRNPILESEIKQNPDSYCRFPIDAKTFFVPSEWSVRPMIYPRNKLPKNDAQTKCMFYECVRTRGV